MRIHMKRSLKAIVGISLFVYGICSLWNLLNEVNHTRIPPDPEGAGLATPLVLEGPAGGAAGGVGRFLYEDYPAHVELLQQERQAVLREGCYRHPELRRFRSTRGLFHIIADTNHEVLFAFCPKVASTTWLRMMIQISGRYRGDIPLRNITLDSPSLQRYGLVYLSKLSAAEGQQKLDSYKKVLFVRNPFERVLSAYKDKLSSAKGKMLYQRMFGRDIMKRKRPNATNEELKTGVGVTFPEFVSWLVDIENVLALDPHFRPIHTLSKPCVLHYDFIGRFETLHDDIDYVLHKLFKLESTKHLPFHNMSKETSKNVIAQNYRNVPTSHIEKIREIYKLDFHLFGYSKDVPGL